MNWIVWIESEVCFEYEIPFNPLLGVICLTAFEYFLDFWYNICSESTISLAVCHQHPGAWKFMVKPKLMNNFFQCRGISSFYWTISHNQCINEVETWFYHHWILKCSLRRRVHLLIEEVFPLVDISTGNKLAFGSQIRCTKRRIRKLFDYEGFYHFYEYCISCREKLLWNIGSYSEMMRMFLIMNQTDAKICPHPTYITIAQKHFHQLEIIRYKCQTCCESCRSILKKSPI